MNLRLFAGNNCYINHFLCNTLLSEFKCLYKLMWSMHNVEGNLFTWRVAMHRWHIPTSLEAIVFLIFVPRQSVIKVPEFHWMAFDTFDEQMQD